MFQFKRNTAIKKVLPKEFSSQMTGDYLLLDVRTRPEHNRKSIKGSKLIPLDMLEGKIGDIQKYKDKKILVYCQSGARSMSAARILARAGFGEIYNLVGGIVGYSA